MGDSYTEGDPTNEETKLASNMVFSERTFSNTTARFDNVTGYLKTYILPSHVILSPTDGGETRTISVDEWGMIEIN